MPKFCILMNLTEQGVKTIKEFPSRLEMGTKLLESMGGKLLGFYVLLGPYDYLGIGEAPSDEVAMQFSLALSAQGNVRTNTLRAFTAEEFAEALKKLP